MRYLAVIAGLLIALMLLFTVSVRAGPPFQEPTPTPTPPEGCLVPDAQGGCLVPLPGACEPVPPENEPWTILRDWMAMHLVNIGVNGFFKPLTSFFWWIEKLVAAIVDFLMHTSIWQVLWTALMDGLRRLYGAGGALERLMFGATGLVFLAVGWAGISLMLPFQARIARIEKVLLWSAIITSLFISAGTGFDLMNGIERQRVGIVEMVLGTGDTQLNHLVAVPMRAQPSEMVDYSFALPAAFEAMYFPEAQTEEREAIFRLGCIMGSPMQFTVPLKVEPEASRSERQRLSGTGFMLALLTLAPAWVLGLFGLSFAVLSAAAMLLMVFFLATLPMVLFEFAEPIVLSVVRQYLYVFALTILVSVLAVVLSAATLTAFPAGDFTPNVFITWLPLLLIVGLMMGRVSGLAWGAMTGSFSTVTTAVASVSSMAPAGGVGQEAKPLSSAGTVLATMGLAAVTGGAGAALVAGIGSAMRGTGVGRAAGQIAAATGGGRKTQTLAAATRGQGLDTAVGVVATNIRYSRREAASREREAREAQRAERAFDVAVTRQSASLSNVWGAVVSAGGLLVTDLGALDNAEAAYFGQKDRRAARLNLERAYGSADVARDVVGIYERDGQAGAARVRAITEIAQATALGMEQEGLWVFDVHGGVSEEYRRRLRRNLARAGVDFQGDAELWGRIAGAVVRRADNIWSDDQAAHKLARDTLEPERAEVKAGDVAAQFRLRDLALKLRWDEGQLAALYDAVRSGQAAAAESGRPVVAEVADLLRRTPAFRSTRREDLDEAARLAVLVADGAEVQKRSGINLVQPVPLAVVFDDSIYGQALKVHYRDRQPEKAREILMQAVGSREGAEAVHHSFGRYGLREAVQLPIFMGAAQMVSPAFDAHGMPTPGYKQEVVEQALAQGADARGEDFFDAVADELLIRLDARLLGQADQVAEAVLRRGGALGVAAQELQEFAQTVGWQRRELSAVVAEAVMGTSAQAAAELPLFAALDKSETARVLALARDAAWEYAAEGAKDAASY